MKDVEHWGGLCKQRAGFGCKVGRCGLREVSRNCWTTADVATVACGAALNKRKSGFDVQRTSVELRRAIEAVQPKLIVSLAHDKQLVSLAKAHSQAELK